MSFYTFFRKAMSVFKIPRLIIVAGELTGLKAPNGTVYTTIFDSSTVKVIDVDSTEDALRITQRGTGNALTVEDSANPDTSAFIIDTTGRVGLGAQPSTQVSFDMQKDLTGATSTFGILQRGMVQSDSTSDATGMYNQMKTQAAVFNLGAYSHFRAFQSTIGAGSTITIQSAFTVESNLISATTNYAFISRMPSGTGRWGFYSEGTARNYFAGGIEPLAGSTTQAVGFINISSAAGAPTGVPTNPTGNVPLYYDTANNKLYVYNGGWKASAAFT